MKKILITGVLNQPFGSFPVASQSDDGVSWDTPTAPFSTNDAPTAIATDESSIVISNAKGWISVSNDNLQTYTQTVVSDGFNIASMIYSNNKWLAAGQKFYNTSYGPYDAHNDIAQIHSATNPFGPWSMVWISNNTNSFLYQIKKISLGQVTSTVSIDVIVAVGSIGTTAYALYSIDNGTTWNEVTIPAGVSRLYSVSFASVGSENSWYWGSANNLYKSENLTDGNWTEVSINSNTIITDMVSDDENLIAAGTDVLHTSQNGVFFNTVVKAGYVFDKVSRIQSGSDGIYLAFMRSNLTQYTHLTSNNGLDWTARNNNITVSGCCISI